MRQDQNTRDKLWKKSSFSRSYSTISRTTDRNCSTLSVLFRCNFFMCFAARGCLAERQDICLVGHVSYCQNSPVRHQFREQDTVYSLFSYTMLFTRFYVFFCIRVDAVKIRYLQLGKVKHSATIRWRCSPKCEYNFLIHTKAAYVFELLPSPIFPRSVFATIYSSQGPL